MKRILTIIAVALAATLASSCLKGSGFLGADMTMGIVKDGKIEADHGYEYTVTKDNTNGEWTKLERLLFSCYITEKTEDGKYNIELNDFVSVPITKVKGMSEVSDWEAIKEDPVLVNAAWIGGDYLNIRAFFPFVPANKEKHNIALYMDEVASTKDTVKFDVRHDAGKDGDIDKYAALYSIAYSYNSFPIEDFLPAGQDSIAVAITYNWFEKEFEERQDYRTPRQCYTFKTKVGRPKDKESK